MKTSLKPRMNPKSALPNKSNLLAGFPTSISCFDGESRPRDSLRFNSSFNVHAASRKEIATSVPNVGGNETVKCVPKRSLIRSESPAYIVDDKD